MEVDSRILKEEIEVDRRRLQQAQAQLASLQAEVQRALAGATSTAERSAHTSAVRVAGVRSDDDASRQADELAAALRLDLVRERRLRDEGNERLGSEICEELALLGDEIAAGQTQREAQDARLRLLVAERLRDAEAALDAERASREHAHQQFMRLIEELALRTGEEIAHERQRRVS